MDYNQDSFYLRQALEQAQFRFGECAPNPSVGCIVVKEGHIIAQGLHWGSGHAHAEVDALTKISEDAAMGATLYVTLEPCCHWGKTPPCTDLIIKRGIARVVYGYADPDARVSGRGHQLLLAASVKVEQQSLPEIDAFYASYRFWHRNKRPFVTAKIAISLDGKIAAEHFKPVAITGEEAKYFTHRQRQHADALLTTARTINADNPQLNIRLPNQEVKGKPVYILDTYLNTFDQATIFSTASSVILFHSNIAPQEKVVHFQRKGVRCIAINREGGTLQLSSVLDHIGKDGIHSLWIEAGSTCFSAFMDAGLVQKAYIYIAPKLLGVNAILAFNSARDYLANAKQVNWQSLGKDILCEIIF